MTEEELRKFLTGSAKNVTKTLLGMPKADRRKLGAKLIRLQKERDRAWMTSGREFNRWGSLPIALLACCSLSQLKSLRFPPMPDNQVEVLRAFDIEFVAEWVEYILEAVPHWDVSEVWEAGLCPRPTSDAFIMGYYAPGRLSRWVDGKDQRRDMDAAFFETDVWRFFEVEGGGELSLGAHDKYSHPERTWAARLLEYVDAGKLDRGRLLDATLEALSRDFAQFRAGWYSRFHEALVPTIDERIARRDAYLTLLASTIPPTVSFALKALKLVNKAAPIPPKELIAAMEAPLQARQKATVTTALQMLADAAKRAPDAKIEVARTACLALVSEDSGVQEKALALIDRLGMRETSEVAATLADYVPFLAPALQAEFADVAAPVSVQPILRRAPEPVVPVANADEALARFLEMLEDQSDPFLVEAAFDGVARFGAALAADDKAISPVKRRALQLWKKDWFLDLHVLAARMWTEGLTDVDVLKLHEREGIEHYHNYDFHLRNREILDQVRAGHALPMLSMPTDTAGFVDPGALRDRLSIYRDAGVTPGARDLDLALLRLSDASLPGLAPETDAERSLAYAVGGPGKPDKVAQGARDRRRIADGVLAYDYLVQSEERYAWVDVKPLFDAESWLETSKSNAPWYALLCPAFSEVFFRNQLVRDFIFYDESDRPTLEAFFRPGGDIGPLGCMVLALSLGSGDRETRLLAAEAVASLLDEERLARDVFVPVCYEIMVHFMRPVKRYAESLGHLAQSGPRGARFACDIIEGTMVFGPSEAPTNYGALLELYYNLGLTHGFKAPERTIAFLAALEGGGKIAKFGGKIRKELA